MDREPGLWPGQRDAASVVEVLAENRFPFLAQTVGVADGYAPRGCVVVEISAQLIEGQALPFYRLSHVVP